MWQKPLLFLNFVIAISIAYIPAADAEIYKWVDAQGQTHYTQHPPPEGVEAKTMDPSTKVDSETAQERLQGQIKIDTETREKRLKQDEERRKAEAEKARKQELCDQAKKRLASYSRPRVNVVEKDGSRRRATEEERQAELAKAREAVKKLCN